MSQYTLRHLIASATTKHLIKNNRENDKSANERHVKNTWRSQRKYFIDDLIKIHLTLLLAKASTTMQLNETVENILTPIKFWLVEAKWNDLL